jgi:hypothetical protein
MCQPNPCVSQPQALKDAFVAERALLFSISDSRSNVAVLVYYSISTLRAFFVLMQQLHHVAKRSQEDWNTSFN